MQRKTGKQKIRIRNGKGEEKIWERVTVQANDWNDRSKAEEWRRAWADACNKRLSKELQIDYRSHKRRGLSDLPTLHEGYVAREMENRGKKSEICEYNRQIMELNRALATLKIEIRKVQKLVKEKGEEINDRFQRLLDRRANLKNARHD